MQARIDDRMRGTVVSVDVREDSQQISPNAASLQIEDDQEIDINVVGFVPFEFQYHRDDGIESLQRPNDPDMPSPWIIAEQQGMQVVGDPGAGRKDDGTLVELVRNRQFTMLGKT